MQRSRLAAALAALLIPLAALLIGAARNYGTSGEWRCTGSCTIPSGGRADLVTSMTIGGSATTSVSLGAAVTDFDLGALIDVDELAKAGRSSFNICGEATTINNNTVYYGPSLTLTANTSGGQACDINAAGNTTEATVDEAVYTNQAVAVLGMTCRNEADANADISFTLRTAAGATVPSVTCTISDGERDCVADIQTTTDIAAGATVAVAGASTSDVADGNGFVCQVEVAF